MGYTHYFDNAELKRAVVQDIKAVVKNSPVPLAGWDGKGKPVVNVNEVSFNGEGDDSFETFRIRKDEDGFNFCKTGVRPYDVAVVACLVSLIVHDASEVTSDGTYKEWAEGIKLYESVCGKLNSEDRAKIKKSVNG